MRGWFGYALSWFWVDEGPSGSTRFDGRHLLSLGIEGTVPGGVEIKGTLGFGAGLPMTAVGLPSQGSQVGSAAEDLHAPTTERVMNSGGGAPLELAPVGDFLRMDLEIAWQVAPRIGGRRTELQPYIKILNALNRRDAPILLFRPVERRRGPSSFGACGTSARGTALAVLAPCARARWLPALRTALLVFMMVASSVGQPAEAQVPSRDSHMEVALRVLSATPLIDGHNDLPSAIRDHPTAPMDVSAYGMEGRTPGHTDIPRLRQGRVGGQFWSVYVPSSTIAEGTGRPHTARTNRHSA